MSSYPEHEKLSAIQDKSQIVGEFLDWLQGEKGYSVCSFQEQGYSVEGSLVEEGLFKPTCKSIESLLAEFFKIDLKLIEKEKIRMLQEMTPN